VTAGNASGINDGAAAIVLASAAAAKEKGLEPLAKVVAYASTGVDPAIMGMGPVSAVKAAVSFYLNVHKVWLNITGGNCKTCVEIIFTELLAIFFSVQKPSGV